MNTTPFSTLYVTSTAAADPPTYDQDQPQADPARRALVLGGGGSAGNAWLVGVIAGLVDAGLDVTGADLIIGTSAGSTAAAQITSASPARLLADILAAAPPPRTRPVGTDGGRAPRGRWPTTCGGRARSSPPPRTRRTCAAHWVRRRSSWMPGRRAPGERSGGPPSPPGCPAGTGRRNRCSSRRSTPMT